MNRQAVFDLLEEVLTISFLTAGPALGAAIALAWLIGLISGTCVALFR